MKKGKTGFLPFMLFADRDGRIFEHPYYRMAGCSLNTPGAIKPSDLIPMPEFSKLFFIPECPPIGFDPETRKHVVVPEAELDGIVTPCFAVAAFSAPGYVRSHLPAVDYDSKTYILPMWAYTAVGFKDEEYWITAYQVEHNHRWDPANYDDRKLMPAIKKYRKENKCGPLVEHLANCATVNHCFAGKNLFFERWEAPIPVSRTCNAACIGCLSLQQEKKCTASHHRIQFKPSVEEIVSLAVRHLTRAKKGIVSFGQGCEGEPITEHLLIAESIKEIRAITGKGTINLNTNGSIPERVGMIAKNGLDSIRISLNSARPEFYHAYYRPKNYTFEDVIGSISLATGMGLYTMINYLVFPGITDQEEEIDALIELVKKTRINFIHLKNLCIDPQLYINSMPAKISSKNTGIGIKRMTDIMKKEFPDLKFGYFNQPVR